MAHPCSGGAGTRRLAATAAAALAGELTAWFAGIGPPDSHFVLAPLWIAPLLALSRGAGDGGNSPPLLPDSGRASLVVGGLVLFFGLAWTAALTRMAGAFRFSAYDLGIYSSVAFNTANGRPFFSSVQQMNHLGEHFSPVVAAFAPLYLLAPTPAWLLAAGLAAYLAVPFVLLRLARRHGLEASLGWWIGPALALLWLLNRPMASAIRFLFHPSTLAAPFVLLAWDAAARRRWGQLAAWLGLLLLFKESLALAAAGIGLWLLARRETRAAGAWVLATALVAAALITGWFIPAMRGAAWEHAQRLAPLADLPAKAAYVALLLLPFGFLHLRSRALLPALPLILLNVATGFRPQYGMGHHYDDTIVPLLFAGALGALAEGARPSYARWPRPAAAAAALVCALATLGPAPLRTARTAAPTAAQAEVRAGLRALGADRRTGAGMLYLQSSLDPFVQRVNKAGLGLLDAANPPPGAWAVLSPHVSPWPDATFEAALARVAGSGRFVEEGGFAGLRVFRAR